MLARITQFTDVLRDSKEQLRQVSVHVVNAPRLPAAHNMPNWCDCVQRQGACNLTHRFLMLGHEHRRLE